MMIYKTSVAPKLEFGALFSYMNKEDEMKVFKKNFFPISEQVMLLEGIVSVKCRLMHERMYA